MIIEMRQLMAAVEDGEMLAGFVWRCPKCEAAISYADELSDLAEGGTCPTCDEDRELSATDIEVVFRTAAR